MCTQTVVLRYDADKLCTLEKKPTELNTVHLNKYWKSHCVAAEQEIMNLKDPYACPLQIYK